MRWGSTRSSPLPSWPTGFWRRIVLAGEIGRGAERALPGDPLTPAKMRPAAGTVILLRCLRWPWLRPGRGEQRRMLGQATGQPAGIRPAGAPGDDCGPDADRDSGTSARVAGPGRSPRQVPAARIGKAISRCTRRLHGPEGLWSVQPPAEGPQQRLAGDAEQFVAEEASLVRARQRGDLCGDRDRPRRLARPWPGPAGAAPVIEDVIDGPGGPGFELAPQVALGK